MNKYKLIVLLAIFAFITGCSNAAKVENVQPSGFLENYALLKPVPSPENTYFFTYENPDSDKSHYHAVIVEPVYIYEGTTIESNVTRENIEKARLGIETGLDAIIDKKYQLAQRPGPDVMRLNVAITGAYIEEEGFKPWNIIPVSAAITIAKKATDLDAKRAILVVELKFTDSQTGKLIKETVTTMSGDDFRKSSNISAQFEQLAQTWTEHALPVL